LAAPFTPLVLVALVSWVAGVGRGGATGGGNAFWADEDRDDENALVEERVDGEFCFMPFETGGPVLDCTAIGMWAPSSLGRGGGAPMMII
jgi:hypothetical protein